MQFINHHQTANYIEQFSGIYNDRKDRLINKPTPSEQRQCTDVWCILVFFLIVVGFVVYSAISINTMISLQMTELKPITPSTSSQQIQQDFLTNVTQQQFVLFGKTIGICIGIACGISLIVTILLKIYPQIMVYGMSFSGVLIIVVIALYDFIEIQSDYGVFFIILAAMYILLVFLCWQKLKKAAHLMKAIGNFILKQKKILVIVLFALIYCIVLLALWIVSFYSFCTLYSHEYLSYAGFVISIICWSFCLFFFNFYFYYTSVFLISQAITIWFYGKQQEYDLIVTPFKHMVRYHLGTITFASLVIAVLKMLQLLFTIAHLEKDGSFEILQVVGTIVKYTVSCFLGAMQVIVEIVNNYAVILTAAVGTDLMQGAKITGQLLLNNKDNNSMFGQFTVAMYLVRIGGVVMVSFIPTLVGSIILFNLNITSHLWILGVSVILFSSSMIGLLFIQIFVESTTALFFLYTLDRKLAYQAQQGVDLVWLDDSETDLFEVITKRQDKAKQQEYCKKYKIRTTIVLHANGTKKIYKSQITNQQIAKQKEYLQKGKINLTYFNILGGKENNNNQSNKKKGEQEFVENNNNQSNIKKGGGKLAPIPESLIGSPNNHNKNKPKLEEQTNKRDVHEPINRGIKQNFDSMGNSQNAIAYNNDNTNNNNTTQTILLNSDRNKKEVDSWYSSQKQQPSR